MKDRVDFSANASVYDRRHGAAISDDALERLWTAAGLHATATVLDIGAGTGRIAIPLAARGCRVVALEPSLGMLEQLQQKVGDKRVFAVSADGACLPFPGGCFDAVVIARLLYLTPAWRKILAEADRILAAGGCLLHEWGNGEVDEEWVQIREEARRLFEQAGIPKPFHPGVRSVTEVDRQLADLRFVHEGDVELGPGQEMTLKEFLRRLETGELSYVWDVPEDVRAQCLPRLWKWSEQLFDLERNIAMPRAVRWTVYRSARPLASSRETL